TLKHLKARLDRLQRSTCPFTEQPELNAPTTWVEPDVVAEVCFQSGTDDGRLRAPVFLRLRDDIDPKTVRRDEPDRTARATPGARGPVEEIVAQLENTKAAFTLAVE